MWKAFNASLPAQASSGGDGQNCCYHNNQAMKQTAPACAPCKGLCYRWSQNVFSEGTPSTKKTTLKGTSLVVRAVVEDSDLAAQSIHAEAPVAKLLDRG
jgi:hypothetical protein